MENIIKYLINCGFVVRSTGFPGHPYELRKSADDIFKRMSEEELRLYHDGYVQGRWDEGRGEDMPTVLKAP